MIAESVINEIKLELIEKKQDLLERIEKLEMNKTRANGPLAADSKEQAVELQGNEVVDALDELETKELGEVQIALQLIENGTYGKCLDCGVDIPENRLRAIPHAKMCISCITE